MGPSALVARGAADVVAAGVGVPVEAVHLPRVLAEEAHGVLRWREPSGSKRHTEPSPEAAAQRESWDSDHAQSKSASEVGKGKIGAGSSGGEVKDDEVATGNGDEGGGGGSRDGRRRRRVRRKKKRPPYIGEGPLVPAPVNARDEKTFSPSW